MPIRMAKPIKALTSSTVVVQVGGELHHSGGLQICTAQHTYLFISLIM